MNSPVEEIKARLNIVELVGAYVRLQKSGTHWKAPCPFHYEKSPSFMVSEERQMWHCFGCNKGGDAFSFLMEIEGIEFKEALRLLAEKTGVELPRYSKQEADGSKDRSYEILELATKFYEKQLWDGAGKKRALPYLRDRGLTDETIKAFRLGYAPDGWRNAHDFLISRGYTALELEKAGLVIRKDGGNGTAHSASLEHSVRHYDRFRERIMFPIMDVLGRVIGYSARVTPGSDESQAKYINTPETGVYHKSQALYGIQRAKQPMKASDSALLVEGNMDVIASHQAGIAQTVAVSGTALTAEQLTLIKRYTENLLLFFDMDEAGQRAARRSTELALEKGMNVRIVAIPEGKDAADIAREHPEALKEAVAKATPALQYFLDRLLERHDKRLPDGKRAIAHDYLNLLRFVAHAIDRSFWVKKLAESLEVEENILLGVLEKLPTARPESSQQRIEKDSPATTQGAHTIDKEIFHKRSELLRRNILRLMLLDDSAYASTVATIEKGYREFFGQDPVYVLLRDGGPGGVLSWEALLKSLEGARQQQVSRLYFEGERMLEGTVFTDEEERAKHISEWIQRLFGELDKELRKEELLSLERSMRDAAAEGDKERERLLREQFNRKMALG